MSTVCVYLYAVAHLQLELLGLCIFGLLFVALEEEGKEETLSSCFATCPMEYGRGGRKSCKGDGERGNDGRGSRIEECFGEILVGEGDRRGGVGGGWK
jgi:hypothetical protein